MSVRIKDLKIGDNFTWMDFRTNKIYKGVVVNFNDMTDELKDLFETSEDSSVWVKLFNWKNAVDGTEYDGLSSNANVEFLSSASTLQMKAPKNNDGRAVCFWCNVPTQKRGGGNYDVCPKCGR